METNFLEYKFLQLEINEYLFNNGNFINYDCVK